MYTSETPFAKLWRQAWEKFFWSRGKESKGNHWRWRRKRYMLPVERKKASVRKETVCIFRHDTQDTVRKQTRTHCLPHLLSQPYHEVEVCRGREVSEAKVTMGPFFDNCVDIIWRVLARERFVNIGILPSANFVKTETGCKSGETCLFPHCKADEQPKAEERLLPKKKRKWRQRRRGYCEKRITIGLCIKRLGFTRFSGNQRVSVKSRCRKSWTQFKEFDSPSPRYVMRIPRTRKDHRLEKHKSKIIISEVPTLQNSRIGPRKRLKDKSDVAKARLGIFPNKQTSSKRTIRVHSSRLQKSGFSCLSKSQRYGYGEWERLTLLSWRPWGHREVRRRWWRPTARLQTREGIHGTCQRIGPFRDGYASWRNFRRSFFGETLWGSWVIHTTGKAVKNTSHQKWQENWLQ